MGEGWESAGSGAREVARPGQGRVKSAGSGARAGRGHSGIIIIYGIESLCEGERRVRGE